jgi:hypothetical protein
MFTKGIILSETEYRELWSDFVEMLRERINELDEEEKDELLKSREELEDWVKEQVIEMFDFILEDHDVEEAMIHLKGKWHYVTDAEAFYYLSYRQGDISNVIKELEAELKEELDEEELEEELEGSVEKSRKRRFRI